jgi:hypothetical protein
MKRDLADFGNAFLWFFALHVIATACARFLDENGRTRFLSECEALKMFSLAFRCFISHPFSRLRMLKQQRQFCRPFVCLSGCGSVTISCRLGQGRW